MLQNKFVKYVIWMSPVFLVAGGFFAAAPWLKTLDDAVVTFVSVAAAIAVITYSVVVAVKLSCAQDEVQRAGARFAFQIGALGGSIVTVFLMMIPPFMTWLVETANAMGTGSAATSDGEAVRVAIVLGFGVLTFMQAAGALLVNAGWNWWVGRP